MAANMLLHRPRCTWGYHPLLYEKNDTDLQYHCRYKNTSTCIAIT